MITDKRYTPQLTKGEAKAARRALLRFIGQTEHPSSTACAVRAADKLAVLLGEPTINPPPKGGRHD